MASPNSKSNHLEFKLWMDALGRQNKLMGKSVMSVSTLPSLSDNQRQGESKFRKWNIHQLMKWILYHPWYGWCQDLKKVAQLVSGSSSIFSSRQTSDVYQTSFCNVSLTLFLVCFVH